MSEQAQIILFALTIVSSIIGALAYKSKKLAEARATKIENDAKAELAEREADTQIRIQSAKDKSEEDTFQREQLRYQLTINDGLQRHNQQFLDMLQEKERQDESNYRVLADTQRDIGQMLLTEIQNQSNTIHKLVEEMTVSFNEKLESVLETIPTLGAEVGMTLARQVALHGLDRDLLPFPSSDDPRWETVFIAPTRIEAWIYSQPLYDDNSRLQKKCARITTDGIKAKVIRNQLRDWTVVIKENGESCFGYLPNYSIKISQSMT